MGFLSIFGCDGKMSDTSEFANEQTAYQKSGNLVTFYNHKGEITKRINLEKGIVFNYNTVSLLQIETIKPIEEIDNPILFLWESKLNDFEKQSFNNLGLITERLLASPDDGGGASKEKIKYKYNKQGLLIEKSGVAKCDYDDLGRMVLFEDLQFCDKEHLYVKCKYEIKYEAGRIKEMNIWDNKSQMFLRTYTYKENGEVEAVEKNELGEVVGVFNFKLDSNEKITEIKYTYKSDNGAIYEKKESLNYDGSLLTVHKIKRGFWLDRTLSLEEGLKSEENVIEMRFDKEIEKEYLYKDDLLHSIDVKEYNEYDGVFDVYQYKYEYNGLGQMTKQLVFKNKALEKEAAFEYGK